MAYQSYAADVRRLVLENTDFRRVLHTTERTQLVLMCVEPGGEIGEEIHTGTDQILAFVSGRGEAILGGQRRPIAAGDVVVVPEGTRHNFVANAGEALRLYTIYSPPHHRPGTVHATKSNADADTADIYG
ncbi:cupin domain-containing protein [bacterium]|nr:MAG: cupin domain-containing protein [bacterium]